MMVAAASVAISLLGLEVGRGAGQQRGVAAASAVRLAAARVCEDPVIYGTSGLGKRMQAALGGGAAVLRPAGEGRVGYDLTPYPDWKRAAKALGLGAAEVPETGDADGGEGVGGDEEIAALREEEAELAGHRVNLFRDPSGALFGGRWVEGRDFWSGVQMEVTHRLKVSGRLHG